MGKYIQLYKIAAPKWTEKFEQLSPEAQQRIANLGLNERTLRHLGKGSSNISDLVIAPHRGLLVRKLMKIIAPDSDLIDASVMHRRKQLNVEKRLRDLAMEMAPDKVGPFAHLRRVDEIDNLRLRDLGYPRGVNLGKAYYDYVPGVNEEVDSAKRLQKIMEKRYGENWKHIDREAAGVWNDAIHGKQSLGSVGDKILEKLKSEGHPIWDVRGPNIVDGKLVDFEGVDPLGGLKMKEIAEDTYRDRRHRLKTLGMEDHPKARADLTANQIRQFWMQRATTEPPEMFHDSQANRQADLLSTLREKHSDPAKKIRQMPLPDITPTKPVVASNKMIRFPGLSRLSDLTKRISTPELPNLLNLAKKIPTSFIERFRRKIG